MHHLARWMKKTYNHQTRKHTFGNNSQWLISSPRKNGTHETPPIWRKRDTKIGPIVVKQKDREQRNIQQNKILLKPWQQQYNKKDRERQPSNKQWQWNDTNRNTRRRKNLMPLFYFHTICCVCVRPKQKPNEIILFHMFSVIFIIHFWPLYFRVCSWVSAEMR